MRGVLPRGKGTPRTLSGYYRGGMDRTGDCPAL
jgi:hypothetical protein